MLHHAESVSAGEREGGRKGEGSSEAAARPAGPAESAAHASKRIWGLLSRFNRFAIVLLDRSGRRAQITSGSHQTNAIVQNEYISLVVNDTRRVNRFNNDINN